MAFIVGDLELLELLELFDAEIYEVLEVEGKFDVAWVRILEINTIKFFFFFFVTKTFSLSNFHHSKFLNDSLKIPEHII
jgi:hypothetical protein